MSSNDYEGNVFSIESLEQHAEDYIYGYFEDIKRKVDLRRQDVIQKIHNYSDEIIKSIKSTQSNCLELSKGINQLTIEVEKSKRNLNGLIEKFKIKQQNVMFLKEDLAKILKEYYESLLDFKKYSFDFSEIPIKNIFGEFYEIGEFDSHIMDTRQQKELIDLCEIQRGQKWKLLYRATRDGFNAADFHVKCDRVPRTLTVIKATSGNIFGGFTEISSTWNYKIVVDPNAYIFSLVNKNHESFRTFCSNDGKNAMRWISDGGPCFGFDGDGRKDICIVSNSNVNQSSYSNFGYLYKNTNYPFGTEKAKSILAGSFHFQTSEIEVFAENN